MGEVRAASAAGVPDGTLTPRFAPGLRDGTGNWSGDTYRSCQNGHWWSCRSGIIRPLFRSMDRFLPATDPEVCPGCGQRAVQVSVWRNGVRGFGLYGVADSRPGIQLSFEVTA